MTGKVTFGLEYADQLKAGSFEIEEVLDADSGADAKVALCSTSSTSSTSTASTASGR